jgi:hypothetical protein
MGEERGKGNKINGFRIGCREDLAIYILDNILEVFVQAKNMLGVMLSFRTVQR